MDERQSAILKGREVIAIETRALAALEQRIDEHFAEAVELLFNCAGRVIVTGVGKSGLIGRKIAATLNSTGACAGFLHPADALHGDLGMVRKDDVVLCISKSGASAELNNLLPMFRQLGAPVIALTGSRDSPLARAAAVTLDASVAEEACPHDLAPTASSTAALALGDALAIALLERRRFGREDFALFHPGGALGRRLSLTVDELMATGAAVPRVAGETPLRETILEMTSKRLGCACVVSGDAAIAGIITDGDLRRQLQKSPDISGVTAAMAMTRNPKRVPAGTLAFAALQELEAHNISQLLVVDAAGKLAGLVHLHELVKAGLRGDESA